MRDNRAFTLIELLIVLLIISIVAGIAVFALGDLGRSRRVAGVAQGLAAILPAAEEQAILQPAVLGLALQPSGYAFYQFVVDPDKDVGAWQPIQDSVFRAVSLPAEVAVTWVTPPSQPPALKVEQASTLLQPQIIFLPSGDITPFELHIGAQGGAPNFVLTGQANGAITLKAVSTP